MSVLHLEYTLNANDLAEGRRRWTIGPGVVLLAIAAFTCGILISEALEPDVPLLNPLPVPAKVPLSEALIPFLPWLVMLFVLGVLFIRFMRLMSTPPWKHRRQRRSAPSRFAFWLELLIAIAMTVGAAAWAVAAKRNYLVAHGPAADPHYSPVVDTVVSIMPMAFIGALFAFLLRRASNPARLWARQYNLQRPFATEIEESGIRISESFSRHEYKWSYFRGFNETPNLILLYPSSQMFVMIPKRAFPTSESQKEFLDLLARQVVPPTAAFPVVPVASPSVSGL